MKRKRLRRKTLPDKPGQLCLVMSGWWAGRSIRGTARDHGLSRRRVQTLLAWVGCTQELRDVADTERADSDRMARPGQVADAWAILTHPLVHRLTVRQRAAAAWRAHGLILTDIGRRMLCSPQGAHQLLEAARWRLKRLAMAEYERYFGRPQGPDTADEQGSLVSTSPLDDIGPIDIEGLVLDLSDWGENDQGT